MVVSLAVAAALLLLADSLCLGQSRDVILEPVKRSGAEAALVLIQDFQIRPEQYLPLAKAVQNASNLTLWVGIPEFFVSDPAPSDIEEGVERIIASLRDAGMEGDNVAFAGHSLGGASLQRYLVGHSSRGFAQVLLGSFLQRKYRSIPYPIPTLTVGGELDGVCRVSRIMESYYHSIIHTPNHTVGIRDFPVVVVEGMSNMQFASGAIPQLTKDLDLRPEISYDEAHRKVGALVSAFLDLHAGDSHTLGFLSKAVMRSGQFLKPLLTAFELEGYHNFKPPCNDKPPNGSCTVGSSWSEQGVVAMGDLKEVIINDSDSFHPSLEFYPHDYLPHLNNSCSTPSSCTLEVFSVTENVYEELDNVIDSGFVPISAYEMRVKMVSRQVMMEAAGYRDVDFNTSDGYSVCKLINQASYNWAIGNASNRTLQRYTKYGVPYVMGNDEGPYNIFPEWVYNPLQYKHTKTAGEDVIIVQSPTLRTPKDYFLKISAGFHFCKVLSPARVMEWVYVDSLRENYGMKNVL